MEKINIGYIGLGGRGMGLLSGVILPMNRATVVAVCDNYEDRTLKAAEMVKNATGIMPICETDYKKVIDNPSINTIIIATSWENHINIAVQAMRAGKAVAMEVGGAYCIEDCWKLVDTYEETKVPFMFLENCCFGRREMMVLHMVRQGMFGEIVHCSGGYHHDLRQEITFGKENRHYRLNNYIHRNGENYPTHELGPIAKILEINHGNRFVSLTSTASKSVGLHDYIVRKKADDEVLKNKVFEQGDVVTTVIKCAHGQTITLTLDTTLPRFYSRAFTVRGTRGMYEEATDSVFLDNDEDAKYDLTWRNNKCGNADEIAKVYEHPVWKEYLEFGVKAEHDGMDWLEFRIFFDCLQKGIPMPVDVYDAAAWMAVTTLSEQSIAQGSVPVSFPDFTRGSWIQECATDYNSI